MRHRDALWMAAAALALGVATIAVGERIGINHGTGWDGAGYTRWARDFPGEVLDKGVTVYQAQRVLPSLLVGALPLDDVVLGFQLLDAACLVVAAYLWGRIGLVLAWSRAAAWAGFAGVFGSFAIARHALYYPTLTDATAFALGMAMVWAFLARRPIALWGVAVAGAITWPALAPVALALLVMPRVPLVGAPVARPIAAVLAALAAAAVCYRALDFLAEPMPVAVRWAALVPRALLVVTLPVLAAWTALAWYALLRRCGGVAAYARGLVGWRTLVAIGGGVALYVALAAWVDRIATQGPGPTMIQFQCELVLEALRGPLWGPVHHVVYFGPLVLVAIGAWPHVARIAASWGAGAVLAAALIVAFAIGSESRQWIHLFPLLAALAIAATHEWWTPRRALAFALLCLAWSKLWWPIHYLRASDPFAWPAQRYFMQQGPWASTGAFLAHAAAIAATAVCLLLLGRGQKGDRSPAATRS